MVLATALTGTCAQLLTTGQGEALATFLADADAADVVARARFDLSADTTADAQRAALAAAATALSSSVLPADAAEVTGWSTSARYVVPNGDGADAGAGAGADPVLLAHLGSFDGPGSRLSAHARLERGRWPEPPRAGSPLEVVAPVGGPAPGTSLVLRASPADDSAGAAGGAVLGVVVVGSYRADRADPAWQLDPLRGAGSADATGVPGTGGRRELPSTGPLLVDPSALGAVPSGGAGSTAGGAVLAASGGAVVVPQLGGLGGAAARALTTPRAAPVRAVEDAVAGATGQPALSLSVVAGLPAVLASAVQQGASAASGVLVATVVGVAAALAALAAAAQLLAERRRAESALLVQRGAATGQRLAQEGLEAGALALLGLLVGLPLAAVAARGLESAVLPGGGDGSSGPLPLAQPAVLAACASVALLAATVVLLPHVRAGGMAGRVSPRGALARSGGDLLLLVLAGAVWWQLREEPGTGTAHGAVAALTPALALLAGALVGLRVLGLLRRGAQRAARRTPHAVPAVVAWSLSRAPLAAAAAALVVLAVATGTTATAWRATWWTSQAQQAGARWGADLTASVAQDGAATGVDALGQATALAAAGASPAPVLREPVSLGSRVGAPTGQVQPVLVALTPAGARGAGVAVPGAGAVLTGPVLPAGSGPVVVVLTANASDAGVGAGAGAGGAGPGAATVPLRVQPALVVQDGWGTTALMLGPVTAVDGAPHELELSGPARPDASDLGALRVVAADLRVLPGTQDEDEDGGAGSAAAQVQLDVDLALPGAAAPADATWSTTSGLPGVVSPGDVELTTPAATAGASASTSSSGPVLAAGVVVATDALPDVGAVVHALASSPPRAVPVVISRELADQFAAGPGSALEVGVGAVRVSARVVGVSPAVPTAPGTPALLADADAVTRALLAAGSLPRVERWWVGGDGAARQRAAATAAAFPGLGFDGTVDRAQQVRAARTDPLDAPLRAAWLLLASTSVLTALAGSALLTTAAAGDDAALAARLGVLGVTRSRRAAAVLLPRALQLALALLVGAGVGLVVTAAVVPVLVRAPDGSVPVPRPGTAAALRLALDGGAGPSGSWLPPPALAAVLLLVVAAPVVVAAVRLARGGDRVSGLRGQEVP